MSLERIHNSWHNLCIQLNLDLPKSQQLFSKLINAYSSRERRYHNLQHINQVLDDLQQINISLNEKNIIQLATWFHDVVYKPQVKNNEQQSAIYAQKELELLEVDSAIIQEVQQIILSTQNHLPLIEQNSCLIFLDLDLAILGSKSQIYRQYSQAIRQEYAWLSNDLYNQGRKQILTNLLSRNRIYYTDYWYQQLETRARINIRSEINQLLFLSTSYNY